MKFDEFRPPKKYQIVSKKIKTAHAQSFKISVIFEKCFQTTNMPLDSKRVLLIARAMLVRCI